MVHFPLLIVVGIGLKRMVHASAYSINETTLSQLKLILG
jgi:hypothetical protein